MGGATKLFRKYGNLQVPRTWRNWHAEPTFAPPKVAVLTVVQVSDAWSAHRTFWLSDQLSVRNYSLPPRSDLHLQADSLWSSPKRAPHSLQTWRPLRGHSAQAPRPGSRSSTSSPGPRAASRGRTASRASPSTRTP